MDVEELFRRYNAGFSGTDLIKTNLTGADLTGAELDEAWVEDCIFCNTIMPDGSIRTDIAESNSK